MPTHIIEKPTGYDIKEKRNSVGLSQQDAADLIYSSRRTWQDWEAEIAPMHQGLWELFLIKVRRRLLYNKKQRT